MNEMRNLLRSLDRRIRLLERKPGVGLDTGWINCTSIQTGFTVAGGQTPQMRQIGNVVYCRGMLSNNSVFGVGWVMSVPTGISVPGGSYTAHFAHNANSGSLLNRYLEVRSDGKIYGWSTNASTAWWAFTGTYLTN